MRVTNKMLSNNFITDMRNNLQNMQTLQQQMTSGKLINKASDDPFKAARVMQLNTDIGTNTQYNKNISDIVNWLDTTDTALSKVGDAFGRIRDQLLASGNGGYGPTEKKALKDEINAKISEISQLLNTNFDGKYVFGGTRGEIKPMEVINNGTASNGVVTNILNNLITPTLPALPYSSPIPGKNTATLTGTLSVGTPDSVFKLTSNGDGTGVYTVSTSTDGGANWSITNPSLASSAALPAPLRQVDLANGLKINIADTTKDKDKDQFIFAATALNPANNSKLVYNSGDPNAPELGIDPNLTKDTGNAQINQINSSMYIEISKGVKMQYNVKATDVLEFKNQSGTAEDVRQILTKIVNHLDGNNDNGTAADPNATSYLSGTDLTAITDVVSNILTIRSKVGADQNSMDNAKLGNESQNDNMIKILSSTEDIDITEKTMEYATLQTVYTASLQTSAKIIQPSLLDYLR